MFKRTIITLCAFLLVGGIIVAIAYAASAQQGILVQEITSESACPAYGCTGSCHNYDSIPQPELVQDGTVSQYVFESEQICPESPDKCSNTNCHAWETIQTRYHQASDASLNIWVLAPIVLVAGLILLVKKVK